MIMRNLYLWVGGLIMTIATSILTHNEKLNRKFKVNHIIMVILVIFEVAIVGGIPQGWATADIITVPDDIIVVIFLTLVVACLIWLVGATALGIFSHFKRVEIVIFVCVYIISSICFTQVYFNYNNNIEYIHETVTIDEQNYLLMSFDGKPVQHISGNISGHSSGSLRWESGDIQGSISTSDKIPYWYYDANGDCQFNSVEANVCKLRPVGEGQEVPLVVITTFRIQTKELNHNTGEEKVTVKGEWKQYLFILPPEFFPLNR